MSADLTPAERVVYDYLVENGDLWPDEIDAYTPDPDNALMFDFVEAPERIEALQGLRSKGLVRWQWGGIAKVIR